MQSSGKCDCVCGIGIACRHLDTSGITPVEPPYRLAEASLFHSSKLMISLPQMQSA